MEPFGSERNPWDSSPDNPPLDPNRKPHSILSGEDGGMHTSHAIETRPGVFEPGPDDIGIISTVRAVAAVDTRLEDGEFRLLAVIGGFGRWVTERAFDSYGASSLYLDALPKLVSYGYLLRRETGPGEPVWYCVSLEPPFTPSEVMYGQRVCREPREVRRRVLSKTGGHCFYCWAHERDGVAIQIEHMTPRSRGGTWTMPNLVPACRPCNMDKMVSDLEEYRARCAEKHGVEVSQFMFPGEVDG